MRIIAFATLLCLLLTFSGCQPAEETSVAEPSAVPLPLFALVVKDTVNPYMQVMYDGFSTACAEIGAAPMLAGPDESGAPTQEDCILSLLDEGVAAICIAANNRDELSAVLQKALQQGVVVVSLDSAVYPQDRMLHIEQAPADVIGRVLMQAGYSILKGEGEFAILTTTKDAPNQTVWLQWMEKELADHAENYADMLLEQVAYGEDDYETSYQITLELLEAYPDLDIILSITSVGLLAAADAIAATGSDVQVTGLGLPSDMQPHIITGVCPWMYLWNPSDLGYLAVYAADLLHQGALEAEEDEIVSAGSLGDRIITASPGGGVEIVLDNPIMFDLTNVAVWAELF